MCVVELPAHLLELAGARDTQPEVCEVVGAVLVQHEAVVPVVHAQITTVRLAVVDDLHAEDVARRATPCIEVLDAEAHVAEFGYLNHHRLREWWLTLRARRAIAGPRRL